MPLFHYIREHENFIDAPHVSIKVGSGCPAGCDCDFSYKKLKVNTLYDSETLKKNILMVDESFSPDFEIFLVGLNLLRHEKLEDLLSCIAQKERRFKLQIHHNLQEQDVNTLMNLIEKYGAFHCSVPKTIDSKSDLSSLMSEILLLSKIPGLGKVYFDVFLDQGKYKKIIQSIIQKFSTQRSNNEYNCIIGESFDIKFHDLSWRIDHENKVVSNLKRTSCMMREYFELKEEILYLYDHIEVFPNGDLTFHDNLCYAGNYKISNIKFPKDRIQSDFALYKAHLVKINSLEGTQGDICYHCIKNPFLYTQ